MSLEWIEHEVDALFDEMVAIRRDFHENPELSFEEVRTPRIIAEYLNELGLVVRTQVGGRGVVGILKGGKPGKTIAMRADFDALPIEDLKDVPYKSKTPGIMHACGHDGHTAALLGAAKVLTKYKDQINGNVVFLFQHAEEKHPGGAVAMIEDGCLEGVDVIFGAHLQSMMPAGNIYYHDEGHILAAADMFRIKIIGKGGHGAMPHSSIDPIMIGSQLIVNLQQIVSRMVNPLESAVLSIGSFHAGTANNVIPETAEITGTVRTYNPETRKKMESLIGKMTKAICETVGASYDYFYEKGYDSAQNDKVETEYIKQLAIRIVGDEKVQIHRPFMAGDDFSYYLKERPGSFFIVGGAMSDPSLVFPHHHPRFDFDEKALLTMAKMFVASVTEYEENVVARRDYSESKKTLI
ncbi:M20 family metallopeptidase [Neobacillus niacini]|uniref:M20 family metallopeptidase n=1 Tax=Neobacillus niacini TaxID=86668 RepID=UPI0030035086